MAQYEDIRTSTVAIIGVIGALVVFIIVILLMVLYQGAHQQQTVAKDVAQPYVERDTLVAQQESLLGDYKWLKEVDEGGKKREVYAIPISRAMSLVVAELSAGGDKDAESHAAQTGDKRAVDKKPAAEKPGAGKPSGGTEKGGRGDAKP